MKEAGEGSLESIEGVQHIVDLRNFQSMRMNGSLT